jgi:hypothetical protein
MTKTITRLYDSYMDAEAAVRRVEQIGFSHDDISLVANDGDNAHAHRISRGDDGKSPGDAAADDAGKAATAGGVLGAAGGVLTGLGLLAIPGLGPVVAAGWLATTAVGAVAGAVAGGAAGGLVGALTHAGVREEDAHVYAEGVRRGGTVVSVKTDDARAAEVERCLDEHSAVDLDSRGASYRDTGWTGFDDTAAPYAVDDLSGERDRLLPR